MRIHLSLLALLGFFTCLIKAQHAIPAFGLAFPQGEVATVRITIDPDSMEAVLDPENWENEREFPASFRFESSGLNQSVANVGFRLRGNTSMHSSKKSFKVSFNTYTAGAKWLGLEKLNLNGSANDPSMVRVKLCWDALRESGLPAARTGFVKLYINEEYKGLYTNVEHIDEEFTQKFFDNSGDGNLYKCLYPAALTYSGPQQEPYKAKFNGRKAYELKTNDWTDDYTDLVNFITILNQTSIGELPCALEKVFNVESFLHYAAMDVLMGNWDGYNFNQNNYYLYHNRQTGLLEYLPYDLDNTLGIDWVSRDWGTQPIYGWNSGENRPLYTRLLQVPECRSRFSYYIRHALETSLNVEHVEDRAEQWIELISEAADADPYRSLDFGFTMDDFHESLEDAWGNHVKYGIVPFLETRSSSALVQADAASQKPAIMGGWITSGHPVSNTGIIKVMAEGAAGSIVSWEMSTDGINFTTMGELPDNGSAPDLFANDNVYTASLPDLPPVSHIYYQFKISDGITSEIWPCGGRVHFLTTGTSPLVINEVMSKNESTIPDESGDHHDWIELWNSGENPVDLYGKFLSDDPTNPGKWPLPADTIAPGEFLLIWSDSEEDVNRYHTNFSLSADGEDLRMYEMQQAEFRMIDRINFPALSEDISYGRENDGSSQWKTFLLPTPDGSNGKAGIADETGLDSFTTVYPNPATDKIIFREKVKILVIRNMQGRIVYSAQNCVNADVSNWASGVYFIEMDGNRKLLIKN